MRPIRGIIAAMIVACIVQPALAVTPRELATIVGLPGSSVSTPQDGSVFRLRGSLMQMTAEAAIMREDVLVLVGAIISKGDGSGGDLTAEMIAVREPKILGRILRSGIVAHDCGGTVSDLAIQGLSMRADPDMLPSGLPAENISAEKVTLGLDVGKECIGLSRVDMSGVSTTGVNGAGGFATRVFYDSPDVTSGDLSFSVEGLVFRSPEGASVFKADAIAAKIVPNPLFIIPKINVRISGATITPSLFLFEDTARRMGIATGSTDTIEMNADIMVRPSGTAQVFTAEITGTGLLDAKISGMIEPPVTTDDPLATQIIELSGSLHDRGIYDMVAAVSGASVPEILEDHADRVISKMGIFGRRARPLAESIVAWVDESRTRPVTFSMKPENPVSFKKLTTLFAINPGAIPETLGIN